MPPPPLLPDPESLLWQDLNTVAARILKDHDAVQEVMLAVWRSYRTKPRDELVKLTSTTAVNLLCHASRERDREHERTCLAGGKVELNAEPDAREGVDAGRLQRHRDLRQEERAPQGPKPPALDPHVVRACLAELPLHYRDALWLQHCFGLSQGEIGALLRTGTDQVNNWQKRGREALAKCLRSKLSEETRP